MADENSWEEYDVPTRVVDPPKKKFGWLLYLSPVLIVLAWIIVHVVLVPEAYSKAVSLIEWFSSKPTALVKAVKDFSGGGIPGYKVILLIVYNWLTIVGLFVSLFFIGRAIQNKRPKRNVKGRLQGKEPYLMTMELLEEIKMIGSDKAEKAVKAVRLLNDRLKNESAFGEGTDAVIDCENEIEKYLQSVKKMIPDLRQEATADEAGQNIELYCQKCMAKLKARIELKKR